MRDLLSIPLVLLAFSACNGKDSDTGRSTDTASTVHAPADLRACFTDLACPYVTSVAHRGALRYAPENTLVAFQMAADLGADAIETDVRTTADGVLILMHDSNVATTTDGSGEVSDLTWAEIQALHVRSDFEGIDDQPVPTFREALDLARSLGLAIDLDVKDTTAEALAAEIEAADMVPHVFLNTGSVPEGKAFRGANPDIAIMPAVEEADEVAAYESLHPELIEVDVLDVGLGEVGPAVAAIDARLFTQSLGIEIGWVSADTAENQWTLLLEAGVVVIQTDYPEVLAPLLAQWNDALAQNGATWPM